MAEGDFIKYYDFPLQCMRGTHDLENDTIKAALVTGYTPDQSADTEWADISANEESGTGYTAGGVTIAITLTTDGGTGKTKADGPDPSWTGLDVGTPSHLIFYNDTAANKNLICAYELGRPSNGGNYTAQINAGGLFDLG